MLDIPLQVPLDQLASGRFLERDHACHARIQVLRESLDRAALAGGITAFEYRNDTLAG